MAWITTTDIGNLISPTLAQRLTDDSDPAVEIDATVWAAVAAETEAEVAAALSRRYPTQCTAKTASVLITSICKVIAYVKLCFRRPEMAISQAQLKDYEHKMSLLAALRNGEMDVDGWSESSSAVAFKLDQYDEDAPDNVEDWLSTRDTTSLL